LHEELYSIEFYATVLLPVRRIQLKWTYLASPEKEVYQQSVLGGWIGAEQRDADDLYIYLENELVDPKLARNLFSHNAGSS
jgi:hypothetical protein